MVNLYTVEKNILNQYFIQNAITIKTKVLFHINWVKTEVYPSRNLAPTLKLQILIITYFEAEKNKLSIDSSRLIHSWTNHN